MRKENSNYKYIVVTILFLGLFIGNYFQYQLSPLAARIMKEFHLTPVQFSSIFSAPMLASIFLGIIAGILSDKFGVKKICAIGLIIMTIGLWIRPFSSNYMGLYIGMILAGFGVTSLNINMSKIISAWFEPSKIGPLMGITMAGCTLGMTLATATTAYLPSTKIAFFISAILCTIILIIWLLFMKDGQETPIREQPSAKEFFIKSLKNKNIWLVGLCLMCIMGCNVCLTSFLPTALMSRGVSEQTAGLLTSALTLGNLFGSFIGTALIAKLGKIKPCLIVLSIVVAVCSAFAWSFSTAGIVLLLGVTGFAFGTLVPIFMSFPALLPEIGPECAGSATGIVSTLELIGAVVIPTYIITPIAGQNFSLYFILAGICMIVCAIVALLLPELLEK